MEEGVGEVLVGMVGMVAPKCPVSPLAVHRAITRITRAMVEAVAVAMVAASWVVVAVVVVAAVAAAVVVVVVVSAQVLKALRRSVACKGTVEARGTITLTLALKGRAEAKATIRLWGMDRHWLVKVSTRATTTGSKGMGLKAMVTMGMG